MSVTSALVYGTEAGENADMDILDVGKLAHEICEKVQTFFDRVDKWSMPKHLPQEVQVS